MFRVNQKRVGLADLVRPTLPFHYNPVADVRPEKPPVRETPEYRYEYDDPETGLTYSMLATTKSEARGRLKKFLGKRLCPGVTVRRVYESKKPLVY